MKAGRRRGALKMNDNLGSMLLEEFSETRQITNINFGKLVVATGLDLGQIALLNLG